MLHVMRDVHNRHQKFIYVRVAWNELRNERWPNRIDARPRTRWRTNVSVDQHPGNVTRTSIDNPRDGLLHRRRRRSGGSYRLREPAATPILALS
jgi:hypothetical protein